MFPEFVGDMSKVSVCIKILRIMEERYQGFWDTKYDVWLLLVLYDVPTIF